MKHYLLTGSTGSLGRYVLHELLKATDRVVHCLIRQKPGEESLERIITSMQQAGLWHDDFRKRILPIHGNLGEDMCGIDEATWTRLRASLDAVFHIGADVSFLKPYSQLEATNVRSVMTLCRLGVPVNFASSASIGSCVEIFDSGVPESCVKPREKEVLALGYGASKLKAELVLQKHATDFRIFRLPRLTVAMGSSGSLKAHNTGDLFAQLIKSSEQMGMFPNVEVLDYWLPVDFAARAIVALALSQSDADVFHLMPDKPLELTDILECGKLHVTPVEMTEWETQFSAKSNLSDLKDVLGMVLDDLGCEIKGQRFQNALTQKALLEQGIRLPAESSTAFSRCIDVWREEDPAFGPFVKLTQC